MWPHGVQNTRLPCPSSTPGAWSNSRPSGQRCHSTISPSVIPFSSWLQSSPAKTLFKESVLHIRWPKYWSFSFSISPSNEYSGLISFRIDWFDLLEVQGTLWVAMPSRSSQPRNQTGVSCVAGGFFTSWSTREAQRDMWHCIEVAK